MSPFAGRPISKLAVAALLCCGVPASAQSDPAPVAPAPAEAAPAAAPAAVSPDRVQFDLKIPADRGGGTVSGAADSLESYDESTVGAAGEVEIRYKEITVRAGRLTFHRDSMTVEAEGEVIFDQGPNRIAGERLDFDLVSKTGTFWNATAYVHPDYYFRGSVIAKTGPIDYSVEDGVFTSCTGDRTPDWSFALSSADVELEGYARIHNARLRVKKLPVFYWPYLVWPAKTERTTGLLVPNIGYSRRRGAYLGLAHYQVFGPSYDNTVYADLFSEGFYGLGDEFRYHPSEGTKGRAIGYVFRGPVSQREDGELVGGEPDETAWKLDWEHTAEKLPFGLRGVIDIEHYSDFELFRDFERGESQNTRRFIYSNAFLSGNWGVQSATLLLDQRETFLGDGQETVTQRQLPELDYRLRERKLGDLPLYLSVAGNASFLQAERDGSYDAGYGRFDLQPELKLPLRPATWLSMALTAGGRATWWGDTFSTREVDPVTGVAEQRCGDRAAEDGEIYCGETLTRVYPTATFEMVGPSFSKIFDHGGDTFAKFKHVIEPRVTYGYLGDFEEQDRVPQFDEIDILRPSNLVEVSLINRLLAKPSDETRGGAFEILSFELAQAYSLDDQQPLQKSRDGQTTSSESSIFAKLRFNPSKAFSLQAQAAYSTLFSGLDSTSISGNARLRRADLGLTWFTRYDAERSETTSDQVRLSFGLDIVPQRLRLDGQINYDIETAEIQQQRYFLNYTSQCWSVRVEAREFTRSQIVERDYRIAITFKNVGTFLDITGGLSGD
ncbi:MAG: LPS-assembly protein LptD [Thermoanaerobaculia bacterium]